MGAYMTKEKNQSGRMRLGEIIDTIFSFIKYVFVGGILFVAYYFGRRTGEKGKHKAEGKLLDAELDLQLEKNARKIDSDRTRDAESIILDAIREGQRIRDEVEKKRGSSS